MDVQVTSGWLIIFVRLGSMIVFATILGKVAMIHWYYEAKVLLAFLAECLYIVPII